MTTGGTSALGTAARAAAAPAKPAAIQLKAEVISLRRAGEYYVMSLTAAGIPDLTRPGHFLAVACGGDDGGMLLRRAFSIYNGARRGVYGGTVEIVFAVHGKGTRGSASATATTPSTSSVRSASRSRCRASRRPASSSAGDTGARRCSCWPTSCATRGCRVDVVLGAATEDQLFGALDAKRMAATLSPHDRGRVGRAARAGSPTCCRRCWSRPTQTWSTRAGRWRCSPRSRPSRGPRRARPVRGRGVDGLRDRGVHDLRAAGRR